MSNHLLVMLIFITIRLKSKLMIFSLTFNNIEDCFYEKRVDISLHENNDLYDRWVSELDCLDRCLKFEPHRCRSFEHWRSNRHGLCVLANSSLAEQPTLIRPNLFVDYYEIDCQKDTKALRLQTITCPGDQLQILVTLNGIDPNYILLGDSQCRPDWFNETHAQFHTHVDNCSLILTDGSIIGKLRWEGINKETNEARQYERFFLCPSDIYQIRQAHWTSTTSHQLPASTFSLSTTQRLSSSSSSSFHIYNDQKNDIPSYRINLQWILFNRTYICPEYCSISLYSLVYVKLNDLNSISSTFFIDSCDLIGLHPYTHYFRTRRLISRGCSTDPTIIHLSSDVGYQYSFYLYNILKEPIPFQIQCKIFTKSPSIPFNCSHIQSFDSDEPLIRTKTEKKDFSYVIFRSSLINVQRQISLTLYEQNKSFISNSFTPLIAVQEFQCFLFTFSLIIHWTFCNYMQLI